MTRMVRFVFFLLALVSCAIVVFAQTVKKPQTPEQDQSVQLQTQLIEVKAVVTDKQGHIIKNLKKEDFELQENKNPQEISFFSMEDLADKSRNPSNPGIITSGPGGKSVIPTDSPARTVVLYIDTLNLSTDSLLRTKQVLNKFIDEQLTDRDLAALITSTGALGVLEQFTRDKRILHYAVNRLGASMSTPDSMFTPYIAGMVEAGDPTAMSVAISILRTEDHLSGDARFLRMMAEVKAGEVLAEASYRRKSTLWTLKAVAERLADLPGQRIIAVVSDGFSLMDTGGSPDTSDLDTVIGRAVRSGVVIYSIDAKGLTPPPEFDASRPGVLNMNLSSYLSASEQDVRDGINALARDTGGEPFYNNNDIAGLLKRSLDDNQVYYTLAYYPAGEVNVKKYRNIVVKVKNHPEYVVRTQKGYSPLDLIKEKQQETKTPQQKLFQAIASPLPVTNIGVAAAADFLGKTGNPEQVIFQVYIEGKNIDYKEQNNRQHFALDMITVVYDSHGKPVNTYDDKAEGNILPEHFEEARVSGFKYNKALNLKPGLYQIRIGVREPSTDRMGTAMAWITVPNITKNKFAISGLFLGDKAGNNDMAAAQAKNGNKPSEVRQGIRFYKPGSTLVYNVRLYNLAATPNQGADLQVQALIEDTGNVIASVPWQPVSSNVIGKDASSVDIGGQLKLDLEPGIYELHLQIKNRKMKHPSEQVVVFAVER